MTEQYIGDGVYSRFDGYNIWIYTSDGITKSKKICLEPEVLNQLIVFSKQCYMESNKL